MEPNIDGIKNLKNIEYLALGMLCNYRDPSFLSTFSKLKRLQVDSASGKILEKLRKHLPRGVEITEEEDDFPGWDW